MSEKKNHYAADTTILFVALFMDRGIRLAENCDQIGMNVQYIDIVNKAPMHHSEMRWVERRLSKLWAETGKFKRVVQNFFPCTARLGSKL